MSYFLKRMCIKDTKTTNCVANEIEEVFTNIRKRHGVDVLNKQLKPLRSKLVEYFKYVVLEELLLCKECESPHLEEKYAQFKCKANERLYYYHHNKGSWKPMEIYPCPIKEEQLEDLVDETHDTCVTIDACHEKEREIQDLVIIFHYNPSEVLLAEIEEKV
jgi:hypothetical protein